VKSPFIFFSCRKSKHIHQALAPSCQSKHHTFLPNFESKGPVSLTFIKRGFIDAKKIQIANIKGSCLEKKMVHDPKKNAYFTDVKKVNVLFLFHGFLEE
jgi:hypothetical protein